MKTIGEIARETSELTLKRSVGVAFGRPPTAANATLDALMANLASKLDAVDAGSAAPTATKDETTHV